MLGHISGAYINPAMTIGAILCGCRSIPTGIVLIIAEMLGGVLGFGLLVVNLMFEDTIAPISSVLLSSLYLVSDAYGSLAHRLPRHVYRSVSDSGLLRIVHLARSRSRVCLHRCFDDGKLRRLGPSQQS